MLKRLSCIVMVLGIATAAYAEDEIPACLTEKIQVLQLQEQNAELSMKIIHLQFDPIAAQAKSLFDGERAEKERLRKLLPSAPPKQ